MAIQRTSSLSEMTAATTNSAGSTKIVGSQNPTSDGPQTVLEASSSKTRKAAAAVSGIASNPTLWLVIWTCNNIGITLLNKAAFAKVDFRYPYFLSAVHMAINALGSQFVFWSLDHRRDDHDGNDQSCITKLFGNLHRQSLDLRGQKLILAFSVVFSSNIAIGNVSLQHVSVNFNQVMRSLVPAITIAMGFALGKPTSLKRQLAVLPVVVGVAMACFGDMSYTAIGFGYTLLCIFLAGLKVVASGEMLTGSLRMHPFDLLGHMAPLAFVECLALAFLTGEVDAIASRWETELSPFANIKPFTVVMMSGLLSFAFNISSLQTNKLTSPLTLCIAGNVKQVLMIVIATAIFRTEISPLNAAGIVVVLMGSAWYSYVSVTEKAAAQVAATKDALSEAFDVEEGEDESEDGEMVTLISKADDRSVQRTKSAPAVGVKRTTSGQRRNQLQSETD